MSEAPGGSKDNKEVGKTVNASNSAVNSENDSNCNAGEVFSSGNVATGGVSFHAHASGASEPRSIRATFNDYAAANLRSTLIKQKTSTFGRLKNFVTGTRTRSPSESMASSYPTNGSPIDRLNYGSQLQMRKSSMEGSDSEPCISSQNVCDNESSMRFRRSPNPIDAWSAEDRTKSRYCQLILLILFCKFTC